MKSHQWIELEADRNTNKLDKLDKIKIEFTGISIKSIKKHKIKAAEDTDTM